MGVNLRTRYYEAINQQLISIETEAGYLNFMLTRKQKEELIKISAELRPELCRYQLDH